MLVIFLIGIVAVAVAIAKMQANMKTSQQKAPRQKIDYSQIDYKRLYLEKYRMLPNIYFNVTLVLVGIIGLLEVILSSDMLSDAYEGLFSFIVGSYEYISGIMALVIWGFVAYQIARFVRYIVAISLSQKVVVADTLLFNARAAAAPRTSAPVSPAPSAPAAAPAPAAPAAPAPAPAPTPAAPAYNVNSAPSPIPAAVDKTASSDSGNRAVYIYNGHNADLYVYPTRIVISGKGYNHSMGEKSIPMHAISAVQMKASTPMVYGCIEFNVVGEVASSAAGIGAGIRGRISENTVVFASGKDDAKVRKIKEYIESIIYSQKAGNQTIIQQTSDADELKKCKELLDMNIITQEEFEAKKRLLLGLPNTPNTPTAPQNLGKCAACGRDNVPVEGVEVIIAGTPRKRMMCTECAARYK